MCIKHKPLCVSWIGLSLITSACSTAAPPPAVEIRTVTVTREIQRPCAVTVPKRPDKLGPLPTDAVQLSIALGLKLAEYSGPGGLADRALDALETCTKR